MSKISKDGYDQIQVIKNALDSMYDKLDRALRNAEISITFEVMSLFTEKTYNEKLDYLAEEFNLSPKRIEGILHEMKN